MAFGKGQTSTENTGFKRFIGVAATYVRGVNPTKKELEDFYGRELNNDVEYVGTTEVMGTQVKQVRIDFLLEVDPTKYTDNAGNPIELKNKISFFVADAPRSNKDGSKFQIIDKYGRTAWATKEEINEGRIPVYSNGNPANISLGYRRAFVGEEDLTNFLIAYLGIKAPANYVNGSWVMRSESELQDCEARLESIKDYFKGDLSEIKTIIKFQPENKVKVAVGIRSSEDGRQFQTIYNRMALRNNAYNYAKLEKSVDERKAAGGEANTDYEFTDLHEFTVTATDFSASSTPSEVGTGATPWD